MLVPFEPVKSLADFAFAFAFRKISDYLLNPEHPTGASKALFFAAFGFSSDRPEEPAGAFAEQAWAATEITSRPHPKGFGVELAAIGPIGAPDGRRPVVLTAWNWRRQTGMIEVGQAELATFVTARKA